MGLGMWLTAQRVATKISTISLKSAQRGLQQTSPSPANHIRDSHQVRGHPGGQQGVRGAKGLALRLKARDLSNYEAPRQDWELRSLDTQKIEPPGKFNPELQKVHVNRSPLTICRLFHSG